jgi:cytoskeletal protein RodZ
MSLLRSTVYGDGGADDNDDDGMSTSSRSSSIVTSKDEKRSQRMDRAFNEETKQESRYVLRSRKLVMSVFIFATIACGSATYFFVKQTEQDTFQLQVRWYAAV